jgi:hypothetical protein
MESASGLLLVNEAVRRRCGVMVDELARCAAALRVPDAPTAPPVSAQAQGGA